MTPAINGTTPTTNSGSTASATSGSDPSATENMFMSLLVAQLKNQDPTQPTDGVQFLQQLTDINSLEQLLDIHQDLDTMSGKTSASSSTGSATNGSSASGTQGSSGSDPVTGNNASAKTGNTQN